MSDITGLPLAEVARYFQWHRVWRILLNTHAGNTHVLALLERFRFHHVLAQGFVLSRPIR